MQLLVRQGPRVGHSYTLAAARTILGRTEACDIPLWGDLRVSRRHCEIVRSGSHWAIVDVGSTNGTLVNGERIARPTPLRDGDEIHLGGTVLVSRVDAPEEPAAPARPPTPARRLLWLAAGLLLTLAATLSTLLAVALRGGVM